MKYIITDNQGNVWSEADNLELARAMKADWEADLINMGMSPADVDAMEITVKPVL